MTKWYEISVTIQKVFVVEVDAAETINDAEKYVQDEIGEDVIVNNCIRLPEQTVEIAKRWADEVLSI